MTVQHIDHVNLTVRDLAESIGFYGRVFGFEVVERGVRPDGTPWAIARSGDALLCMYHRPELGAPGLWQDRDRHGVNHFGLRIADRRAFEATLLREGIEVLFGGPERYPHSTSWYLLDPSGHEIEVACWDGDRISFGA